MATALSVVIGALISMVLVMVVESLRRPRLVIRLETPPHDKVLNGNEETRWLRVIVTNEAFPTWTGWMIRDSATPCRGSLRYF